MSFTDNELEALVAAERYLKENLPAAEYNDKNRHIHNLAFPNGFTATRLKDGKISSAMVMPDDGDHVRGLVDEAKTSQVAHKAACFRAAYHLSLGEPMHERLRDFVRDVLFGLIEPPKTGAKGPTGFGPVASYHQVLTLAIYEVMEYGFFATKNEVTSIGNEKKCAIDIVAEAMRKLGKRPSNPAYLKDIWEARIHRKTKDGRNIIFG